jgi:type I restriction enzyme S subunit
LLHWPRLIALNSKDGFDGFLFYVMQYFKTVFDRRNSEGTTFGSITKDDLHALPLACPTPDLLRKYNDVVSGHNQMVFTRSMETSNSPNSATAPPCDERPGHGGMKGNQP